MGNKKSGTPKAALLKLNGTQIDADGKITRTDFFNFLNMPLGNFENMQKTLTPEQALKFRNHVVRTKIGTSAAMPKLCGGPRCTVKQCPLHENPASYPLGEPCVIESSLIQMWTKDYMEDIGVDPDSITEMVLVNELVELDILDYRANIGLSGSFDEEAQTLLSTTTTQNKDGSYSESVDVHPLLHVKAGTSKRRQDILKSFTATRQEKYRKAAAMKKREEEDVGTHFIRLREALSKVKENEKVSPEILKNESDKIIDTDWYIENENEDNGSDE